jgi:integrase
MDPLTAGELSTLLNTVRDSYREHYPLFLLLARTGMRIGEALAYSRVISTSRGVLSL